MGGGGSGINRLGLGTSGKVLSPAPFSSLAPPPTRIISRRREGDTRVPGGRELSWAPGLNFPIPPVSLFVGQGTAPLLAQYCQLLRARKPAPPPQKPLHVGGGVDGASAKEADVGP